MRKIKFRGKVIEDDISNIDYDNNSRHIKIGDWIYGDYVHINGDEDISGIYRKDKCSWYPIRVDTLSVGQYTGVKDEDGNEIYEDDIIHVNRLDNEQEDYRVVFEDGIWILVNTELLIELNLYSTVKDYVCFVIGNIRDNPELVKGE